MSSWSNFLREHRVTVLAAGLVVMLGLLIVWGLLGPSSDAQIQAIRAKGYPVTLAELDAWYTEVPEKENLALVYTNIFAQPVFGDSSRYASDLKNAGWAVPARGQVLSAKDQAEVAATLADAAEAVRLLYAAPATGRCRYPVNLKDGFDAKVPHLQRVKQAVTLLGAEAMLDCTKGDTGKALAALATAGRVADSVANEPTIISHLVRQAAWNSICIRLDRVLNTAALTEEQLVAAQTLLSRAERPEGLARCLAGERAAQLSVYTDRRAPMMALSGGGTATPTRAEVFRWSAFLTLYKMTGIYQKDKNFMLGTMATNVAAAELPFPERFRLGQKGAAMVPDRICIFSRILLPALSRMFDRDAQNAARVRTAQVAIAIERFRRAHREALPESLQELAPAYLPVLPPDPFDGQPLRYKRLDRGFVVYSIGSNLADDGGLELDSKNAGNSHDITFRVER